MRKHFRAGLAIAFGMVLSLSVALVHQSPAQGADGSGEFIIRCFYNGNIATEDPIDDPGSSNTGHLHAFFGNIASGAAAMNGATQVPFPTMTAGEDGSPGTMENNGLTPATNCQDSKDTAGYWVPEPFMVPPAGKPKAWLPGGGCSASCSPSKNLYMRVYYIPQGANSTNQEIPDGSIMIAGYPAGCANVDGIEPDGCTTGGPSYPVNMKMVEYSCGADEGHSIATPLSAWPYDCTKYTDADDSYPDGAVAFTRFPDCWNGQSDFPAPNSPVNGQDLPTTMVPGYVAPWISYTAWQHYPGLTQRPANDFSYPTGGNCPAGDSEVIQLEERVHTLSHGQGWGEPSTCTGAGNVGWNTTANSENSPSGGSTPNDTAEMFKRKVNDDGDATVQVGTTKGGVAIWGFHKCVAASAPSPEPGVSTLTFACSHGADPNCTKPTSSMTGCGSVGGTCYVGAYPDGWETLHADYWQTWQEAKHTLDGRAGGTDAASDAGTFGDLMEDCVTGTTGGTCGFVTDTSPSLVYKPGGNP